MLDNNKRILESTLETYFINLNTLDKEIKIKISKAQKQIRIKLTFTAGVVMWDSDDSWRDHS